MAGFTYSTTRANVNPLGSPWETLNGGGLQIVSNVAVGTGSDGCSGYLNSVTNFNDDQFCQADVTTINGGDNGGVGTRCQNSGGGLTGYIAYCSEEGANDRVYLKKWVLGVATQIAAPVTVLAPPLYIDAIASGGNVLISVKNNGTHISGSPFTDSVAVITGGQPALYYDSNTNATSISNVSGGDVGGGPTVTYPELESKDRGIARGIYR